MPEGPRFQRRSRIARSFSPASRMAAFTVRRVSSREGSSGPLQEAASSPPFPAPAFPGRREQLLRPASLPVPRQRRRAPSGRRSAVSRGRSFPPDAVPRSQPPLLPKGSALPRPPGGNQRGKRGTPTGNPPSPQRAIPRMRDRQPGRRFPEDRLRDQDPPSAERAGAVPGKALHGGGQVLVASADRYGRPPGKVEPRRFLYMSLSGGPEEQFPRKGVGGKAQVAAPDGVREGGGRFRQRAPRLPRETGQQLYKNRPCRNRARKIPSPPLPGSVPEEPEARPEAKLRSPRP